MYTDSLNAYDFIQLVMHLILLYRGVSHNGAPQAKSAPVHQVLHFEGPQLVDNFYLPYVLSTLFEARVIFQD